MTTPFFQESGNTKAQTSASGATWVPFPDVKCRQISISNKTGVDLEFKNTSDTSNDGFVVGADALYTFAGLKNANEISFRRVDTSNTQVTTVARWEW